MNIASSTHSVNGVSLHVVEAGPSTGPVIILLHGFPDIWWGWRHQIEHLAELGFLVIVPDQRGYNLSDKPPGISAYQLDKLATDVVALADHFEANTFRLVGHDWGGLVAWWVAIRHAERVERLAIANAPHPEVFQRYLRRHIRQMLKSSYVAFFQLPWLPEFVLRANNFALLKKSLSGSSRPGTFSDTDFQRYEQAWAKAGSLTGMLNYYRALRFLPWVQLHRIKTPTLLIWGIRDKFLETGCAVQSLKLCDSVRCLFHQDAGHWIQLEEAEFVNTALADFFC